MTIWQMTELNLIQAFFQDLAHSFQSLGNAFGVHIFPLPVKTNEDNEWFDEHRFFLYHYLGVGRGICCGSFGTDVRGAVLQMAPHRQP